MISVRPVILSGGSGARLWPLSRAGFPKQFLVLSGNASLFQQAVDRINKIASDDISVGETLVVSGEEHRFLALDQLREMPLITARLILEPEGKNTAPALTLAALEAIKNGDDPILVVTPADQSIKDLKSFTQVLQSAIKIADKGSIVVLGIKPTSPETGFGYIKQKNAAGPFGGFEVAQFVEKPSAKKAEEYLAAGDYLWNSGIFVLRASVWLAAIKQFRPDIERAVRSAFLKSTEECSFIRPDTDLFKSVPSESVDYAVIEKCPQSEFRVEVVPLDAYWNDLGAWSAVWEVSDKDDSQNSINGDVLTVNTSNSLIYANHRLVSVIGMHNVAIIETEDAVLVTDRNESQNVKDIVRQLSHKNREEHLAHRKVLRPWGWYDTIDVGEGFKVKRIQVNPGASLSLQKHEKRAEHWVVIRGIATIQKGSQLLMLTENQSTYIAPCEMHRLSNLGEAPLEIIEVQSGSEISEDDIKRFDDKYGRA